MGSERIKPTQPTWMRFFITKTDEVERPTPQTLGANMKHTPKFQIHSLSAAIAATLFSGYSVGQQANSAPTMREEVIVTATRRAESIQDIPLNISALGSDTIERDRITSLSDIARRVPGLIVVDQGPRSGNILTVRGLNVDSVDSPDGENNGGETVATYYGEIPLYADFRLTDIERVEVLIGPQGTLYGAGTLGGAVRYIPNKPQSDETTVDVRGNIYDLAHSETFGYEGGVTLNIPIVEDKLAFRATVEYADDPGFIDYNFLVKEAGVSNPQPDFNNQNDVLANLKRKEDANTVETAFAKAALRYTGDRLDVTAQYLVQDQEIGARQINHQEAFGTGKYESAHRFLEPKDRKNELYSLEIIADLGFAELTSATGYSEYSENGQRDQTDLLLNFEYGYEAFPSFAAFTREDAKEETFTQELRLVSKNDGPFNWIVGGFYREQEIYSLSQEFTPGFDQFAVNNLDGVALRPDALEYYFSVDEEITELGFFGELSYDITERWQITLGARWFEYKDKVETGSALPLFDTVFLGDPADSLNIVVQNPKTDDDDEVFKINSSYQIDDSTLVYATISEGFRLGGVNPIAPCPDPIPPNQNVCAGPTEISFTSDTTTNYEIGLRSEPGESGILNASIYFLEWNDTRIGTFTAVGGQPIDSNVGTAESYGFELAGQYNITSNLMVLGTYAWNRSELTEEVEESLEGETVFDGDRLPGTPEHTVFLGARYGFDLNDGSTVDLDWSMTANSDVITKIGERANGETLDGFSIHNVSATWEKGAYSVQLYGNNVFDKYAVTGVRRDRGLIRDVEGVPLRRYFQNMIRPREVGINFIYRFEG